LCHIYDVGFRETIEANAGAAAEETIEARTLGNGQNVWQPNDISASVGDVVEWKLARAPMACGSPTGRQ
jgi:plastocyanin